MPSISKELMGENLKRRAILQNVFIFVITLGALSLFISHLRQYASSWAWGDFFVFAILSTLFAFMPIQLPRGGMVSVSFVPNIAAILTGGPLLAECAGLASALIMGLSLRASFDKLFFNASTIVLSLGLAAQFYKIAGGQFGSLPGNIQAFLAILICALTYFFINTIFFTAILSFQKKEPFGVLWLGNIRWGIPSYFALMPVGFLMTAIYLNLGVLATTLFAFPLFLSRYSFQQYVNLRQTYVKTMRVLATFLDAKDTYTRGHSERVCAYSVAIGRAMNLPEKTIESLEYAALLHDVGKIGVMESIISKTSSLTASEFSKMKNHPVIGFNIINEIDGLKDVAMLIRSHHEFYDGNGYPDGIKGEDIPLESRILAVADAYDAMTSKRPYRRRALSVEEAADELKRCAGSQFDPNIVRIFLKIVDGWEDKKSVYRHNFFQHNRR